MPWNEATRKQYADSYALDRAQELSGKRVSRVFAVAFLRQLTTAGWPEASPQRHEGEENEPGTCPGRDCATA